MTKRERAENFAKMRAEAGKLRDHAAENFPGVVSYYEAILTLLDARDEEIEHRRYAELRMWIATACATAMAIAVLIVLWRVKP